VSRQNVELHRRAIEALNARDIEALIAICDPRIEFHTTMGVGGSGADVAMSYAQVMKWRDGLAVYFKGYAHKEDALRDLGVSEHALESIAP
jgi:hypothetical protein